MGRGGGVTPMPGASADAALPAVNIATPMIISRRRPNRSPSAAPVSSSTAKVSVQALTVHSSPSRPVCRAWRITGSAFVTMRLSIAIMNTAVQQARYVQSGFLIRSSPSIPGPIVPAGPETPLMRR